MKLHRASDAWRLLNGVFCVYKPPRMTLSDVKHILLRNLCDELNQLETPPPGVYLRHIRGVNPHSQKTIVVDEVTQTDYSEHPLVVGPHYQPHDFKLEAVGEMDFELSGVCPMAVNEGIEVACKMRASRQANGYEVRARLGKATHDFSPTGGVLMRAVSGLGGISRRQVDRLLARLAANYHRAVFTSSGVHLQSQAAYDLASRGLPRPAEVSSALFYSIVCKEYKRPLVHVELEAINEGSGMDLKKFVHELGAALQVGAVYEKIRKFRHGYFTTDFALLQKHWTLENILNNISLCSRYLSDDALRPRRFVEEKCIEPPADLHDFLPAPDDAVQLLESAPSDESHAAAPSQPDDLVAFDGADDELRTQRRRVLRKHLRRYSHSLLEE